MTASPASFESQLRKIWIRPDVLADVLAEPKAGLIPATARLAGNVLTCTKGGIHVDVGA